MAHPDDGRTREARRIMDRIERETDPGGTTIASRSVQRAADHFSARDRDQDDAIELWGTRLGRVIGLVLTIALLVYLVTGLAPA